MKYALIIFCVTLAAQDQRSVSGTLSGTLPSSAPWNAIGTQRIEVRIHGLSGGTTGARRTIAAFSGGWRLRIEAGTTNLTFDPPAAATLPSGTLQDSAAFSIPIGSLTDIVVRFNLARTVFLGNQEATVTAEVWTPDGAFVDRRGAEVSGPFRMASATHSAAGAFALGHGGGGAEACGCSIAYFRMYSTPAVIYQDLAPSMVQGGDLLAYEFGDTLTGTGGILLSGTPTYSDTPSSMPMPDSFIIRAGVPQTISAASVAASAYQWRLVGAPGGVVLTGENTATPTINGSVFGQYDINLTATDALGRNSSRTIAVGAAPTKDNGVVIAPDNTRRLILGDLARIDTGMPWPRYNWLRMRGSQIYGSIYAAGIAQDYTPLAGTVTVTNGSATVTGTGTDFTAAFGCDGREEYILIFYTDGGPGVSAKGITGTCTATSLTINETWAGTTQTVTWTSWTSEQARRWLEGVNYYDSVLVQYQNYFSSGLTRYRDYARTLASAWWESPTLDRGRVLTRGPRIISAGGMAMWSLDLEAQGDAKATAVRTWIHAATDANWANYITNTTWASTPQISNFRTPREAGYLTYHAAIASQLAPNSGDRATWLSRINTAMVDYWRNWQCQPGKTGSPAPICDEAWAGGAWRGADSLFAGYGSLPWHDALVHEFLDRLRLVPEFTQTTLLDTVLTDSAAYLRSGTAKTGGGAGPGVFIDDATGYLGRTCNQWQYWVFATPSSGTTNADGNQSEGSACTAAPNSGATSDIAATRSVNNEAFAAYAAYGRTADAAWLTFADTVADAAWGCASDGICGFGGRLPPSAQPNLASLWTSGSTKQFGQGFRSAQAAAAIRTGDVVTTPENRTAYLAFSLASVPGAVSIVVELRKPDGATSLTTCLTSPCAITVDRRQGSPLVQVAYWSALPARLALGDWAPLEVR